MNKKEKCMLYTHMYATNVSLSQCYKNPSKAKQLAAAYCERKCYELHGYNMRYHGATWCKFSFSFKYRKNHEEYLFYATWKNEYTFKIADIDEYGRAIPVM